MGRGVQEIELYGRRVPRNPFIDGTVPVNITAPFVDRPDTPVSLRVVTRVPDGAARDRAFKVDLLPHSRTNAEQLIHDAGGQLRRHPVLASMPDRSIKTMSTEWVNDWPVYPPNPKYTPVELQQRWAKLDATDFVKPQGREIIADTPKGEWKAWNEAPPPQVDTSYNARVTEGEFNNLAGGSSASEQYRMLNLLLMYTGVNLQDPGDPRLLKIIQRYPNLEGLFPYPFVNFPDSPVPMSSLIPVVPQSFRGTKLEPVNTLALNNTTQIPEIRCEFPDSDTSFVVPIEVGKPSSWLNTLTYRRNAKEVNCDPRQRCHGCDWCERADSINVDLKGDRRLVNLNPEQMAAFMSMKFAGNVDWSAIERVGVVTSIFSSAEMMGAYITRLGEALKRETNGAFDASNPQQGFTVLAHWGDFQPLTAAGVKEYVFTVEQLDDNRGEVMRNAKGKLSLDDIKDTVTRGLDVFGPEKLKMSYIVGLDRPHIGKERLAMLRDIGLEQVIRRLHKAHSPSSLRLNQCSFPEAVGLLNFIDANFKASK